MAVPKRAVLVFKLLISAFLLYLVFTKVDFSSIVSLLGVTDFKYLAFSVIILFVAFVFTTLKWQALLRVIEPNVPLPRLFAVNCISQFYTMLLPGGQVSGEVVKMYKSLPLSSKKMPIAVSIALDKIIGFISFALLGYAAFLLTSTPIENRASFALVFYILLIGSSIFILLFDKRVFDSISGIAEKVSPLFLRRHLPTITGGVAPFVGSFKALFVSTIYGILFQGINAFSVYLLSLSFGLDVSVFDIIWIYSFVSIILFIPASIMGLGQREISFVYLLGTIGVGAGAATTLSFGILFTLLVVAAFGGLLEAKNAFFVRKTGPML